MTIHISDNNRCDSGCQNPSPRVSVVHIKDNLGLGKPLKLGADPELVVAAVEDKTDYSGNKFTEVTKLHGDEDLSRYRTERDKELKIEDDLHWVELRPEPSVTPTEATLKVKDAMLALRNLIRRAKRNRHGINKKYKVYTGGGEVVKDTLGGHIHISWEDVPWNEIWCEGHRSGSSEQATYNKYNKMLKPLGRLLDWFISIPLQKAVGGKRYINNCNSEDCSTNYANRYARLSAFRGTFYNENNRVVRGVEYRSPPSALKSPDLYYAVMEIAWRIVNLCYEKQNVTFRLKGSPKFEDYIKLGVSRKSAEVMSKLRRHQIGGPVKFGLWAKWEPPATEEEVLGQVRMTFIS